MGRPLALQSKGAYRTPTIHGGLEDCGVSMSSVCFVSSPSSEGYRRGYVGTLAGSDRLLVGNEAVTMQNLKTSAPHTWRRYVPWRRPTGDLEVKIMTGTRSRRPGCP